MSKEIERDLSNKEDDEYKLMIFEKSIANMKLWVCEYDKRSGASAELRLYEKALLY